MNAQTNPFPELARVLSAVDAATPAAAATAQVSLSDSANAVAQVMTLIDQQVSQIDAATITTSFPGAPAMVQALADMKQAAAGWAPTKAAIIAAGKAAVDAGPKAAALGQNMTDTAQIAAAVNAFAAGPMHTIVAAYAQATKDLQGFQSAMAAVESTAASANDQAKNALNAMQVQVQAEIKGIQAKIHHLKSAGSIIIGIISGGISIAVQVGKLNDAIKALNANEQRAQLEQQAYAMAYSQFANALSATNLGVQAMATLNTSLEQAQNGLKDIQVNTSTNAAVMQADLSSFRKEFAGVVEISKSFAS